MIIDIFIILLLILLNGMFAMTELAVVSSRRSRLLAKAEAGNASARVALDLKEDPSKFLSTVQIGITLIGVFAGAYSGVTLAEPLADYFGAAFPDLGTHADDLAIGLVVTAVTYLSLVIGELVPKQIALRHADGVAIAIAVPIFWLSKLTKPLVNLLDFSNRFVLALLRVRPEADSVVSQEEVKAIIDESTESGALEPEEKQMMERVMRLDDITVAATMTYRKDIVWLGVEEKIDSILNKIRETRHSRYLLCDKTVENVVGMVTLKDLILQMGNGKVDLRAIKRKPLYMPETKTVLEALEEFKQTTAALTVIIDEHGELQGIVTLKDIMESIVGTLPEPPHREDYSATPRGDGSWLVDGGYPVHEAETTIGIKGIAASSTYTTLAGFLLHELRHIPKAADCLDWRGWHFEVMDMDGSRVDKLLVSKID
jgi:putative hemolysin